MNVKKNDSATDRRTILKTLGLGTATGLLGIFGAIPAARAADNKMDSPRGPYNSGGLPPVKIKSVKAIGTAPQGANLVVVKVETSEPGLYGLGCATFTQRAEVVVTAINNYMGDFCIGRNA